MAWSALRAKRKNTTWLYRITLNTTITYNKDFKKQQKLFTIDIPENVKDDWSIPAEEEGQKRVNKLMKSIQKLKPGERLIISFVLEELAYKEIAEILGVSATNVGVKITRIKKRLLRIYNNG